MHELELTTHGAARPHRFAWFAAGSAATALVLGVFLYLTGYFGQQAGLNAQADDGRVIIESK